MDIAVENTCSKNNVCNHLNCNNQRFNDELNCTLHNRQKEESEFRGALEMDQYYNDYINKYPYDLFEYIFSCISEVDLWKIEFTKDELKDFFLNEDSRSNTKLTKFIKEVEISFKDIIFPEYRSYGMIIYRYEDFFVYLKNVSFEKCSFHDSWELIEFSNSDTAIYKECTFNYEVIASNITLTQIQFEACVFNGDLIFDSVVIEKSLCSDATSSQEKCKYLGNVQFNKCSFDNTLELVSYLYTTEAVYTKCVFKNEINASDMDLNQSQFKECIFYKDINFYNVVLQESLFVEDLDFKDSYVIITLNHCDIKGELLLSSHAKNLRKSYGALFVNDSRLNFGESRFGMLKAEGISINYNTCTFLEKFRLNDSASINDVVYEECVFNKDVRAFNVTLKEKQFKKCTFKADIKLEDITAEEEVFVSQNTFDNNTTLVVEKSIFKNRFSFNKSIIEKVEITDCIFENKVELKENILNSLKISNSNFEEIADFYKTDANSLSIEKSIFSGFCALENCIFGKNKCEAVSSFKYTTFLDFITFRNSIFDSGIDLAHSNFKDVPNFSNTKVCQDNTNRKTFRLIKHSFESIGDIAEANNAFASEMKQYKKELINNPWYEQKKLVLGLNEKISNFGQNYYKPIGMLLLSTIFFAFFHYGYEENWLYSFDSPSYNKISGHIAGFFNGWAHGYLPFSKFFVKGMEFISLIFYIVNLVLIWQIVVAVKRHTQR